MPDQATSSNAALQAQLDRLDALGPGRDVLGLARIRELLTRLGDPQDKLPPVFHVAGTNGKGSTVAYLRAALEAAGHSVHAYTSPHLVRFNERFRIAGRLIEDEALAALLSEVLDAAGGTGATFFEASTAAMFLAASRSPADAMLIEVGLGGRLDATNVVPRPLVTGIASIGIDHEAFLLSPEDGVPADPIARIGWEKAGIAKTGVPLVTMRHPPAAAEAIAAHAESIDAPLVTMDRDWFVSTDGERLHYSDAKGAFDLPLPRLPGAHQALNAGLAVAMLRHQSALNVPAKALAQTMESAFWPARLQRLEPGPLASAPRDYWLDGGHNEDAGLALGTFFAERPAMHIVIGMLANKHADALLAPLAEKAKSVTVVPVPGHEWHMAEDFRRAVPRLAEKIAPSDSVAAALNALPDDGAPVLICGSLYLAGEVLRANGQLPD